MTRTEAAARFNSTLAAHPPFSDHEIDWPQVRVRVRGYAVDFEAADILVTSVRAVVFRGARVVVVRESIGSRHIVPGGRREAGETLEETCRREVAEESGWRVGALKPLAIFHFHHLGDSPPPGFVFEWCDFLNPVYLAEGLKHDRATFDRTQDQVGSSLMSIRGAKAVLPPDQIELLDVALARRASGLQPASGGKPTC